MPLEFQEYKARKIVNVHKHVDGPWFWGKYTAHPYVGCRSGCEFCYARSGHYLGKRDPNTFDTLIQVKINAVELLRKELGRLTPDIITCGDWQQPAEDRYHLSREMLGVVLDLAFPLFIVERSPLLPRDVDVLGEINRRAWVGVVFSLSNVDPALKQAFEPRSPGVLRRLQAMGALAKAGIQVGASLMPILPAVGDDERHLDDTIRAIKDHGGSFVMAGGLTMDGIQAERTLAAAQRVDPAQAAQWQRLYNWPTGGRPGFGPPRAYSANLGLRVREICARHGLADRMPRYIIPGPLAVNKRIAEQLFLKMYDLELEQASDQRIWAYRKAAWMIDEWPTSVAEIYAQGGEVGLRELPSIGKSISSEIAKWLAAFAAENR
jgi:DNA repair photolyase